VFCDIKMPHRNGFEVLRWFRQQEKLAPIRFVMLSGSNETVDHERARELGADQYLVKFPPEKIFADLIRAADLAVKKAFSLPR
jgi:CheY-like chemotaxis protein